MLHLNVREQNMIKSKSIPINTLREAFQHDAATGDLKWKMKSSRKIIVGSVAGTRRADGYVSVRYLGCLMLAHRVVWAIHHGKWPAHEIDHKNGIKYDNRIENLREATSTQNKYNAKARKSNISSGIKGITYYPSMRKWMVRVKSKYIGYFLSLEEAIQAHRNEEISVYKEFSYHLRPAVE
jgi:hypothetical protein